MENEKLFIGNMNFEATEDGIREMLSQYGTVVSIRLSRKKGHAVVEMSDRSESDNVIKNLDGRKYMERELRISYELAPKKAKAVSVKRFSDRSKESAPVKEYNNQGRRQNEKSDESSRERHGRPAHSKSADFRSPGSRHGEPKRYSRYDSDDRRGNTRHKSEDSSSRNDSVGGYYSQSFKKRAASASQFISKFNRKDRFQDSSDDFMKDEKGRDYRDLEKASARRSSGNRNENFRNRNSEENPGSRYGRTERPARHQNKRQDDDNAGNLKTGERRQHPQRVSSDRSGNSYRDSESGPSRHEQRGGSRSGSGRSSERPSGSRPRTSSRHGEGRTASPRRTSGNRTSGRTNNK